MTALATILGAAVLASLATLRLPRLYLARLLIRAARGLVTIAEWMGGER
jgi:hypothetical protein